MNNKKNIGLVPVRSGSKGIPNKNIKLFLGKPLFWWVCNALENAKSIKEFYLAVDSEKYAQIFEEMRFSKGKIFFRDPSNATDTSPTEDVMLDLIEKIGLKDEQIVLVQATSPWVTNNMIDNAIKKLHFSSNTSLLSVCKNDKFIWTYSLGFQQGIPINYDVKNRSLRQNFHNSLYIENGGFYINLTSLIIQDRCRLSTNVDLFETPYYTKFEIDEPLDWKILEIIIQEVNQNG